MVRKILFILVLSLILLISGCSDEGKDYIPDAKLDLSSNQISINNEVYSQPLTVSIIKNDNDRTSILFVIKLLSPNIELMKFTNLNNEDIININTTEQTLLNGDRISYEFKVWAKKLQGQGVVPYTTNVELWYKDKKIDNKQLTILVN